MTDIYNDNIALLLHMDGADDSTTFTDTGRNGITITNASNRVKVKTAQSKFGGTSADFPAGRDGRLATASSTGLQLGSNNFTIEGWAWLPSALVGAVQLPLVITRTANENSGIWISVGATFEWKVGNSGWIVNLSTTLPPKDTWFHWAFVREGSIFTAYVDGVQAGTTTQTVAVPTAHDSFSIGADRYTGAGMDGYLDEVRITNGVARYTAAFTPPSAAFDDYLPNAGNIAVTMPTPFTSGYGCGIGAAFTVPSAIVLGYGGNSGNVTLPTLRATGQGRTASYDNTFAHTLAFSCRAYGGANGASTMPSPTVTAAATGTNWGHGAVTIPSFAVAATGTTTAVGNADLTFGMDIGTYTLIGYSGAVCSVTLTDGYTLTASSTTGSVGTATLTLPLFELDASGTQQNYGGADLLMPMLKIGATAQAWITMPMFTLTAIGTATVAVTYEAYALNLNHKPRGNEQPVDELTRYTNYPFDRIVRYKNSYYGMNSTGLYLLEGTTDDDTAIPWAWKTHMTDFGSPQKKTVEMAYFGGRLGEAATITLYAGEANPNAYSYTTPRTSNAQNYRQAFGKGLKERYYAIGASGAGALTVDSISLNVATLARRI